MCKLVNVTIPSALVVALVIKSPFLCHVIVPATFLISSFAYKEISASFSLLL